VPNTCDLISLCAFVLNPFRPARKNPQDNKHPRKFNDMNPLKSRPLWLCVLTLALQQIIFAADAYYTIPISSLSLTEGSLPAYGNESGTPNWRLMNAISSYAALDGDGEVYIGGSTSP
jgi:hypothetical protein